MRGSLRIILWRTAALAAAAATLIAPPSRADQLAVGGITYTAVEEIVQIDGVRGTITFVYQGRQMTRPMDGFAFLEMDRYPQLGQAFRAAREGRHLEAARLFDRVGRGAKEEWLRTLCSGLMVQAYERGGQFDRAAAEYVRWVGAGWTAPKVAAPTSLPDRGSFELREGIRALEEGIALAPDESAKFKLRSLLLTAYQRQGDGRIGELSKELLKSSAAVVAQSQPQIGRSAEAGKLSVRDQALLAPVRQAVDSKDFAAGLARAREASPAVSPDALGELFMLVGQCYQDRGDPRRAALSYMRLVIHFPQDRQAAEAMGRSARIEEQSGRPESAARLYETLAQRYPATPQGQSAKAALLKIDKTRNEISGAPASAEPPVVRRPDVLDDSRLLKGLGDYGMTELLVIYTLDNPVTASNSAEDMVRQLDARRAIADDARQSVQDRNKAVREGVQVLSLLIRQFPKDRRLPDWQCEKVSLLMAGLEPRSDGLRATWRRIVFELATAAEWDEMAARIQEAVTVIDSALPDLDRKIQLIEKAPTVDNAEYDRIDAYRSRLKLHRTLADLGRAQVTWARLAGRPADETQAATLHAGWLACQRFFGEAVRPRSLAVEKDPNKRAMALLCEACGHLYAGKFTQAAEYADKLVRDAAVPPADRFDGYTIRAQAMRAAGKAGAMTVLDEQEAFFDSQPAIKSDAVRLLMIRLGRANAIMAESIAAGRALLEQSRQAGQDGNADQARMLLVQAVEGYKQARLRAEQVVRDAATKNPAVAGPALAAVVERIVRDPALEITVPAAPTPRASDDLSATQPAAGATRPDDASSTQPQSQPATSPADQRPIFHYYHFNPKLPEEEPISRVKLTWAVVALLAFALALTVWRARQRRRSRRPGDKPRR